MATKVYKPKRKISATESEEIKIPASSVDGLSTVATSGSYNDLSNKPTIPDVSGKANLDGGNTFTGKQTLNSPASDGYSINAAGYVKGSWLQAGVKSNYGSGTGMVCVFDGSGWIYYRTPAEILTEAGGVTQVKINGATKSPDSTGLVDLGTISGGGGVYQKVTANSLNIWQLDTGAYQLDIASGSFKLYYKEGSYINIQSGILAVLYVYKNSSNFNRYWSISYTAATNIELIEQSWYGYYSSGSKWYYHTRKANRLISWLSNGETETIGKDENTRQTYIGSLDVDANELRFDLYVGGVLSKQFKETSYTSGSNVCFDFDIGQRNGRVIFTNSRGEQTAYVFNREGKEVEFSENSTTNESSWTFNFDVINMEENTYVNT